jgi:hypothetical protein
MPAKKNPITEAERSRRFVETARELEADETGEAFERALKKIVPPKKLKNEPKEP